MSQPFSFSFTGDDVKEDDDDVAEAARSSIPAPAPLHAAETGALRKPSNTAFPVPGQPLLPPLAHALDDLLATLPSKISYGTLHVILDDGSTLSLPRREWWDVRVQLMAEAEVQQQQQHDAAAEVGLGKDDIKTGVYEGGFKSWESSVDLVKALAGRRKGTGWEGLGTRILEMGCGTALPSLALFQWQLAQEPSSPAHFSLSLADYNPSVLQLVTVPNVLLSWAQQRSGASWEPEGELEIDDELLRAFCTALEQRHINLSFFSGAWSPAFVQLVTSTLSNQYGTLDAPLLILGAETIYSPMALRSFAESLMAVLDFQGVDDSMALIAAKKVYFGVGGSIEDFCDTVRERGGLVDQIREEVDGVRRAVVEVRRGKYGS